MRMRMTRQFGPNSSTHNWASRLIEATVVDSQGVILSITLWLTHKFTNENKW